MARARTSARTSTQALMREILQELKNISTEQGAQRASLDEIKERLDSLEDSVDSIKNEISKIKYTYVNKNGWNEHDRALTELRINIENLCKQLQQMNNLLSEEIAGLQSDLSDLRNQLSVVQQKVAKMHWPTKIVWAAISALIGSLIGGGLAFIWAHLTF